MVTMGGLRRWARRRWRENAEPLLLAIGVVMVPSIGRRVDPGFRQDELVCEEAVAHVAHCCGWSGVNETRGTRSGSKKQCACESAAARSCTAARAVARHSRRARATLRCHSANAPRETAGGYRQHDPGDTVLCGPVTEHREPFLSGVWEQHELRKAWGHTRVASQLWA